MESVRERVLGFVRAYPGVHAREVERRLQLSSRLASYHLEALQEHGQVQCLEETGYSRFFPAVGHPRWSRREMQFLSLMRRQVSLRIVILLAQEGESTRERLAGRLNLARASVSHHLALLAEGGLLRAEQRGRERIVRLADPRHTLGMLANFTPLPDELEPFEQMWKDLMA